MGDSVGSGVPADPVGGAAECGHYEELRPGDTVVVHGAIGLDGAEGQVASVQDCEAVVVIGGERMLFSRARLSRKAGAVQTP